MDLPAARLRRVGPPLSRDLPAAGIRRHAPGVAQPNPVSPTGSRADRRDLRPRRGSADDPGVRGRLDDLRRQPVRRLHRHRAVPLVPVRGDRALGGQSLSDTGRSGPPRHRGEVERGTGRHDHPDAAPRPVRRLRHPLGRQPVGGAVPAALLRGRARPARVRRRHLRLVAKLPIPRRLHQGRGHAAAGDPRGVGVLLSRRRRHAPAAVRPRHGRRDPRGLAALAGVGPGENGPRPRRGAALAARDLDRRGKARRVVPRPGAVRVSARARRRRRRRRHRLLRTVRRGPRRRRVPPSPGVELAGAAAVDGLTRSTPRPGSRPAARGCTRGSDCRRSPAAFHSRRCGRSASRAPCGRSAAPRPGRG